MIFLEFQSCSLYYFVVVDCNPVSSILLVL